MFLPPEHFLPFGNLPADKYLRPHPAWRDDDEVVVKPAASCTIRFHNSGIVRFHNVVVYDTEPRPWPNPKTGCGGTPPFFHRVGSRGDCTSPRDIYSHGKKKMRIASEFLVVCAFCVENALFLSSCCFKKTKNVSQQKWPFCSPCPQPVVRAESLTLRTAKFGSDPAGGPLQRTLAWKRRGFVFLELCAAYLLWGQERGQGQQGGAQQPRARGSQVGVRGPAR